MSEIRKLTNNVWSFIDRAAEMHGRMAAERYSQNIHSYLVESGIQSPIEDLFYVACTLLCEASYTEVNPDPVEIRGAWQAGCGVHLEPQAKIGKYRVDFLLSQSGIGPDEILTPVIVELDGHDFHDKDKRQRSYEKARDRFLVKERYRVLHYTGSDVVADPFKCAHEALAMVGAFVGSDIPEYDPKNPLGIN